MSMELFDTSMDITQVMREIDQLKTALDQLDEQTTLAEVVKRESQPKTTKLANGALPPDATDYTVTYTVYSALPPDYVVAV